MGIVFWGASSLGYDCCEHLIKSGFPVRGLITVPRKFKISYSKKRITNVLYKDFEKLSKQYDIPLITIKKKVSGYKDQIRKLNGDLFIVIGWYHLIPKEIRSIASRGCVGIHASLLPKYKGGAPLVWAIINGEEKTGISLFHLDDGVDTGDIVAQRTISIGKDDHISDVLLKVNQACKEILQKNVRRLLKGKAPRIKQKKSKGSYYPQRKPEDGELDLTWDSNRIRNFIRAQSSPYPGAFIKTSDGKKLIIDKFRME